MSALIEPPVAPATPALASVPATPSPRIVPNGGLPESAKITVNRNHDAGEFFARHQAENAKTGATTPAPAAPEPAALVAPAATIDAPASPAPAVTPKGDAVSQLAESFIPESAKPKPAASPADPGPDANPEDRIQISPQAHPTTTEQFKAVKLIARGLRDQLTSRDREVHEAKAEIERLKSGAVPIETSEFKTLKAEHEAMSKRLMVLDLQNHPRFQQEFVAPRSAAEEEAQAILQAHGVAADIPGLLAKDAVTFRKALSEVAAKLPTALDQSDFANAIRTAHNLKIKADSAIQNASTLNQNIRQQTVDGYRQAFDSVYAGTVGSLKIAELQAPTGVTTEQLSEIEAYNQGVRGLRASAERIALGTSDPQEIARASLKAAAYEFQTQRVLPMVLKSIQAKDARIAELESQLGGLRARNPNRDMRGIPSGGGGVDPSKMGHGEAADYYANLGKSQ